MTKQQSQKKSESIGVEIKIWLGKRMTVLIGFSAQSSTSAKSLLRGVTAVGAERLTVGRYARNTIQRLAGIQAGLPMYVMAVV